MHEILNNFETTKSPGIDNISGIFLKDGVEVLYTPQLLNSAIFPSQPLYSLMSAK